MMRYSILSVAIIIGMISCKKKECEEYNNVTPMHPSYFLKMVYPDQSLLTYRNQYLDTVILKTTHNLTTDKSVYENRSTIPTLRNRWCEYHTVYTEYFSIDIIPIQNKNNLTIPTAFYGSNQPFIDVSFVNEQIGSETTNFKLININVSGNLFQNVYQYYVYDYPNRNKRGMVYVHNAKLIRYDIYRSSDTLKWELLP